MLFSFCTVCKNRAAHYKETILKNIQDNLNAENIEFILLDYNSEDDLEAWVKANLMQHIESGLLTYYKTFEPAYFLRSHSRNMAFRLAKGDILCNIDADNFTGHGFLTYLMKEFNSPNDVFVCSGGQFDKILSSDIGGRICISNRDFQKTGGYDEEMSNYGFEDYDLINRLEILGVKKKLITNRAFFNVINHDTKDRIKEEFPYKNLEKVLINYITPWQSMMLLLFSNDTFALATLINEKTCRASERITQNNLEVKNLVSIIEGRWTQGNVNRATKGILELITSDAIVYSLGPSDHNQTYTLKGASIDDKFYILTDKSSIESAVQFFSESYNRAIMEKNFFEKICSPNLHPIGTGIVYKNFDYTNPIELC